MTPGAGQYFHLTIVSLDRPARCTPGNNALNAVYTVINRALLSRIRHIV